jgi:hypothetical protein
MEVKRYVVWSLDSWSDGDGGWSVNDRCKCGTVTVKYSSDKTFTKAFRAMLREWLKPRARVLIDDTYWPDIYVTTLDGEWLYQFEEYEGIVL